MKVTKVLVGSAVNCLIGIRRRSRSVREGSGKAPIVDSTVVEGCIPGSICSSDAF
jgi:hypothetical protein